MDRKGLILVFIGVFIIFSVAGFMFGASAAKVDIVKEELENLYGDKYEWLNYDELNASNGASSMDALVKINDQYSVVTYDFEEATLRNYYESIKRGSKVLENKVLIDEEYVALLSVDEQKNSLDKIVNLRLILEKDAFYTDELPAKLEMLIKEFGNNYDRVATIVFLTDEINEDKEGQYKKFLTSTLTDNEDLYNQDRKDIVHDNFELHFVTIKYNQEDKYGTNDIKELIKEELNNSKIKK